MPAQQAHQPAHATQPAPADAPAPRGFAEGRNRRHHDRLDLRRPVRIYEIGEFDKVDAGIDGIAVDLSRSGIGISTRKMMHITRRVVVLMPGPDGAHKALFGTVVYAAYKEGGRYHIGVRFCDAPASAPVAEFLRRHKAA